ncbi:hypothetical protein PENSUB_11198 [Penicillium subrubescens]|uniref:Pre-rRNA processing protein n=1 Tax=Penicillium subrubescens TaxID=1316194 RepID=A0A1Q5T626_9EURO|nr:hypothetical protein PENSUB_11198 [Penicillium subrubescens]
MADEESRPLLDEQARSPSPGPSSGTATRPDQPRRSFELSSESTPLLHRRNDDIVTYGTEQRLSESELVDDNAPAPKNRSRVRWPTVISLVALTTAVLAILIFAFAAPAIVKEYAQQAAVFKPTALSIDSTTEDGIRARVQGDFVMDAGRVKTKSMRDIGRFMTWIAREVETGESDIKVYLPEYGNILVGNAHLPSIKVNIRNGHQTHVDFLTNLTAGDIKGLHSIARDWIEGRLARLSVRGKATLHLKSGLIGLGTQTLTDTVTFEDITKLNVHDAAHGALAVDVQVSAGIDSPVALIIPSLEFAVFVPNCSPGDPYILVADAKTAEVQVRPDAPTVINAQGLINQLPDELTKTCPGGNGSPLDFLVSNYVQGLQSTIYVRGADSPSTTTPAWIADLLRSVTVPLPFAGNPLDDLMKNFTMTDTHFSLPNPWAEPGSPESQPTVSALVKVLIGLPDEMNVQVEVPSVRALTNVYYHGEELGVLNIDKWQDANSTRVELEDGSSALLVEFPIKDAPLQVTDNDLLAQVVQEMLFGSTGVILHVAATVDAKVETGLGRFAVHGIPGEGNVPVNIPAGNSIGQINPTIASMELGDTTETSLDVSVRMNFTNPTNYSATIPFFDVEMLFNDTAIAHVFARNLSVVPGNNTNVSIQMTWDPFSNGDLGKALSVFSFEVPVPHMSMPRAPGDEDDDDDKPPRFIQEATLHFFSSTAEFTVFSPSVETSITITSMDATAYYDGDEPVGHINYHRSFDVPPGISHSPRLPVDLVLGGVGYDALRKALGQELVLDAVAKVGVRVKNYADIVNYHGNGLAAKVRV